jgi:tRNA pseudouridine13 synthase
LNVPQLEKEIGIEVYATKTPGIGGRLRQFIEDFTVEEILVNGSTAKIEPHNILSITGFGRYLICVLAKRNIDTFQALQAVANKLGVTPDRINIGGIKDARALTAQHVSISRMLPEQIGQIETPKLRLYPLWFSNEKIHSDLLFGNQFYITIRSIEQSESAIVEGVENANNELSVLGGCPNFFGHQRFGTTRPVTHLVGKHILLGEWEEAALAFLAKPSVFEHPQSRQVRQQLWDARDFKEALRYFPHRLTFERSMLSHLAIRSGDFVGAFHRLPKKLCQLFVQGYQSYLFNKFLSENIRRGLLQENPAEYTYKLTIDNREYRALPLIGYQQTLSDGKQGEIERRVLEDEEVQQSNFRIPLMPEISSKGKLRTAVTPVKDLKTDESFEDEANIGKRKVSLSFTLIKGSYATVLLREFMKPENLIEAGF